MISFFEPVMTSIETNAGEFFDIVTPSILFFTGISSKDKMMYILKTVLKILLLLFIISRVYYYHFIKKTEVLTVSTKSKFYGAVLNLILVGYSIYKFDLDFRSEEEKRKEIISERKKLIDKVNKMTKDLNKQKEEYLKKQKNKEDDENKEEI